MKVELELKKFTSADVENLRTWQPASIDQVCFELSLDIGERGKKGGHLFYLTVASPEGLRAFATKHPERELPDRGILVFSAYSFEVLMKRVRSIIDRCARDNWDHSIACLQRYFAWEYEDIEYG